MAAPGLDLTDRFRMPLVRVAVRLQRRDGKKARILAECIVTTLAFADAQGKAAGERHGDGHPVNCQGHILRATPEAVAFLVTTGTVLKLHGFVHDTLTAYPDLADLLPLLDVPPRPKRGGR